MISAPYGTAQGIRNGLYRTNHSGATVRSVVRIIVGYVMYCHHKNLELVSGNKRMTALHVWQMFQGLYIV